MSVRRNKTPTLNNSYECLSADTDSNKQGSWRSGCYEEGVKDRKTSYLPRWMVCENLADYWISQHSEVDFCTYFRLAGCRCRTTAVHQFSKLRTGDRHPSSAPFDLVPNTTHSLCHVITIGIRSTSWFLFLWVASIFSLPSLNIDCRYRLRSVIS